jgi:hypothetical protein
MPIVKEVTAALINESPLDGILDGFQEPPTRNFKAKKCCLYETPYVTASVRETGEDVIARTPSYLQLSAVRLQEPEICLVHE